MRDKTGKKKNERGRRRAGKNEKMLSPFYPLSLTLQSLSRSPILMGKGGKGCSLAKKVVANAASWRWSERDSAT